MTSTYYEGQNHIFYNENDTTVYIKAKTGQNLVIDGTATGNTAAGSDTQVQFNDAGSFGGDTDLTWNKTTNVLTTRNLVINGGSIGGVGSNNQVVYNNSGALTGSVNMTYNPISQVFSIPKLAITSTGNTQLLYNNSGGISGNANMTFNNATNTLNVLNVDTGLNGTIYCNQITSDNIGDDTEVHPDSNNAFIGCSDAVGSNNVNIGYSKSEIDTQISSLNFFTGTGLNLNLCQSIIFSSGLNRFIALYLTGGSSSTDQIYTSVDGSNFTPLTVSQSHTWTGVCHDDDLNTTIIFGGLVFGTGTNKVSYSFDNLATWNNTTFTTSSVHWTDMARSTTLQGGSNVFVAISASTSFTGSSTFTGSNVINYSTGGNVWSAATASATNEWTAICYSRALRMFVVVGAGLSNANTTTSMYSYDGINWTNTTCVSGRWTRLAYSDYLQRFVAVSNSSNNAMYSNNGITWNSVSIGSQTWSDVEWSETLKMFIAVARSGTNRIWYSTDGITFTAVSGYTATTQFSRMACGKFFNCLSIDSASSNNVLFSNNIDNSTFTDNVNVGNPLTSDVNINGNLMTINSNLVSSSSQFLLTNTIPSSSSFQGSFVLNGGISINNALDALSSTCGGTFTTRGGMAVRKQLFIGDGMTCKNAFGTVSQKVGGIQTINNAATTTLDSNFWNTSSTISGDVTGQLTFSNGVFTINKEGVYMITAFASFQINGTGSRSISINQDGNILSYVSTNGTSADRCGMNVSAVIKLLVGNTIRIQVYQNSGTSLTMNADILGQMMIYRVG